MFVFDRSAFAVLLPLALLMGVVLWSRLEAPRPVPAVAEQVERAPVEARDDHALAANFPSR